MRFGCGITRSAPKTPMWTGPGASSMFHGKRHSESMGAAEVEAFLTHLATERGVAAATQNQAKSARLVAALLYGTGMRLLEGLRLRIKHVDFEQRELVGRSGKGAKDRVTVLPENLVLPAANDCKWAAGEVRLPTQAQPSCRARCPFMSRATRLLLVPRRMGQAREESATAGRRTRAGDSQAPCGCTARRRACRALAPSSAPVRARRSS